MTDREMLELAARAAGLKEFTEINGRFAVRTRFTGMQDWSPWNPLTDDGDALRLAVRLNIPVIPYDDETSTGTVGVVANNWGSKEANTRRAITRAAAGMVLDQWSGHGPFDCVKATVPGDGYGVDSPALVSDEEGYTWMSEDSETVADPSNTAAEIGRQMEVTK